ncbi:unnamed protein product [Caenorhabditis auriculariae]|uniref:Uncharacterized protein n=1 Tax=Caenorhabditis auriculariae TaxID=2777116 RepID=A0A8S1GTG3_9PELO|nr:unnamed protein product [Caenorhabditis auriculariae]
MGGCLAGADHNDESGSRPHPPRFVPGVGGRRRRRLDNSVNLPLREQPASRLSHGIVVVAGQPCAPF